MGIYLFKKNAVMQLRHARGIVKAFWKSIQPLQRVPKVACSVASLSPVSGHQLRELLSLHCDVLACYLLGKGLPSACLTARGMDHYNPALIVTVAPTNVYTGVVVMVVGNRFSEDWLSQINLWFRLEYNSLRCICMLAK